MKKKKEQILYSMHEGKHAEVVVVWVSPSDLCVPQLLTRGTYSHMHAARPEQPARHGRPGARTHCHWAQSAVEAEAVCPCFTTHLFHFPSFTSCHPVAREKLLLPLPAYLPAACCCRCREERSALTTQQQQQQLSQKPRPTAPCATHMPMPASACACIALLRSSDPYSLAFAIWRCIASNALMLNEPAGRTKDSGYAYYC